MRLQRYVSVCTKNGFCAKGKSETWKAIDTAAGIFDLLYGIESSSLTNWLARDKKTVGRTTCYLNRALRSQRDLSRCYGKTSPLFPYRKVGHSRLFLFWHFLITHANQRTALSRDTYFSSLHLSYIFRDHAFLFLFLSSLKNFSFFLFFFVRRKLMFALLFSTLCNIRDNRVPQFSVNYPQERDLSRNHPFSGDNFVAVEKLRYSTTITTSIKE